MDKLQILERYYNAFAAQKDPIPEEKRLLLTHLFSNLTLKDKKISYSLKEPVAVLAKRVQEKLDAERSFELQKTLAPKGRKGSLRPATNTLLPLYEEIRTHFEQNPETD